MSNIRREKNETGLARVLKYSHLIWNMLHSTASRGRLEVQRGEIDSNRKLNSDARVYGGTTRNGREAGFVYNEVILYFVYESGA